MKAAQAFPDDYDGLIAGASAPSMPELSARHLWEGLYQQRHPEGALNDADWALVSNAAVIACDKLDGVADGVVEDPRRCRWEAGWLLCRSAKGPQCLTAEQVATVRAIYTPFRDDTGRLLDHGVLPGVRTRPGPPSPLLLTMFAQGAHHDPNWRAEQFRIAADLALANQQMPHLRADSLDLDRLSRRGGKLIMYQGWMDPSVLAEQSLAYFEALSQRYRRSVDSFARLYMVPGMLHCRGGEGADEFGGATAALPYGDPDHDLLAALVRWVEQGRSPGPITASKLVEGRVVRQHPLCPYPQTARYLGGNPDHAASYRCEASAAARRSRRRSDEFGQGAGDPRRGRAHAAGRAPVALAAALAGLQRWTNGKAPQPGPTVEELLARTERFELAREPKPTRFPEIGAPSVPLRSTAA
jgi:feruloyl esterase